MVGTAVQERSGLRERSNEILRADDPADTPARQTPVLGQAVNEFGRAVGVHLLERKEAIRRDTIAVNVLDPLLSVMESTLAWRHILPNH